MFIDLNSVSTGSADLSFTLPAESIQLETESIELTSPAELSMHVEKASDRTRLSGVINVEIAADCTRCLAAVKLNEPIEFEADFVPPEHFSDAAEHEVAGEDLNLDIVEDDRIDLNRLVQEQILLALPEKVLCRPDCKGLCPKCGADRNLIDCKCDDNEIDPRWEALRSLK
jgi:uncharacterized protein